MCEGCDSIEVIYYAKEIANILIYHFKLFTDDKKLSLESAVESESKELDEDSLRKRHLLLTKLSDMGLSVRAYNCLKAADIDTFADLVSYSRAELMKFRNFGRKSLNEIELVDFNEAALASAKKPAKKTTRRSSKKAVEAAPAAEVETPAAE